MSDFANRRLGSRNLPVLVAYILYAVRINLADLRVVYIGGLKQEAINPKRSVMKVIHSSAVLTLNAEATLKRMGFGRRLKIFFLSVPVFTLILRMNWTNYHYQLIIKFLWDFTKNGI